MGVPFKGDSQSGESKCHLSSPHGGGYVGGQTRRLSRSGGHVNFEFLKITAPRVFHQRFELGTLGSESQYASTELNWDFYVKGGDNVLNAKGRANEIGQSRYLADLLDFQ